MIEMTELINLYDNKAYTFSKQGRYFVREVDNNSLPYQVLKPIKDQVIGDGYKYCTFKLGSKLYESVRTNSLSWLKIKTLKHLKFIKWRVLKKYTQMSIFDL